MSVERNQQQFPRRKLLEGALILGGGAILTFEGVRQTANDQLAMYDKASQDHSLASRTSVNKAKEDAKNFQKDQWQLSESTGRLQNPPEEVLTDASRAFQVIYEDDRKTEEIRNLEKGHAIPTSLTVGETLLGIGLVGTGLQKIGAFEVFNKGVKGILNLRNRRLQPASK